MNYAIAYCRYSSDNQREESIDAQLRAIREYCKRNNYILSKTYIDEAKSATTDNRPQFQQMFSDLKKDKKQCSILIVHKLDRFARNRYDSAIYKKKLKEYGIRLKSVLEDLDDSPESIILESVLEGMSEYYSQNLSREVRKGLLENAYSCLHTGGTPALGYDVDKEHRYHINEAEAAIVKEIYEQYNDDKSYGKIAESLNSRGLRTKLGRKFTINSFHDLLKNERYKGVYSYKQLSSSGVVEMVRVEGGIPAIVDPALWENVNTKMRGNKMRNAAKKAKQVYLLSGLVFCADCGSPMSGNSRIAGADKKEYATYECNKKKRERSCYSKGINKNFIEEVIIQHLVSNFFTEENARDMADKIKLQAERLSQQSDVETPLLTRELKELKNKMQNIVNAICDGKANNWLVEQGNEVDERIKYIEGKLEYMEKQKKTCSITSEQIYNYIMKDADIIKLSPERQKAIIRTYVEKVVVSHDSIEAHLYFDAIVDMNGASEVLRFVSTISLSQFKRSNHKA